MLKYLFTEHILHLPSKSLATYAKMTLIIIPIDLKRFFVLEHGKYYVTRYMNFSPTL